MQCGMRQTKGFATSKGAALQTWYFPSEFCPLRSFSTSLRYPGKGEIHFVLIATLANYR